MGLILPRPAQAVWQNNLSATPSHTAPGTLVTAHATIHTKGDYAEIFSATTYDTYGFYLGLINTFVATTDTSMLLDLAIGGAGSEVVILPNFMCGNRPAADGGVTLHFIPLFIPKGSRVAARSQALISADTVSVVLMLNGGASLPIPIFVGCDAYGIDTADSGGTAHTPGSTGAESTDANVGTTLTRDYGGIMLGLQHPSTAIAAEANHWELTDGINTLCEWYQSCNPSEVINGPFPAAPYLIPLKSGAQLQVQAEAQTTGRLYDVAFYCFY